MKKSTKFIIQIILLTLVLFGCGNNSDDVEVEDVLVNTKTVEEEIAYKTIEQEDVELEIGKTELITEGQNGMKKVVYNAETNDYINEWTYIDPIHEVLKVGTKEVVVENTVSVKPPVQPTKPAPVKPTPPVEEKPIPPVIEETPKPDAEPERLGELGNSGMEFKIREEAIAWGDSVISDFELSEYWGKKLGGLYVYGYTQTVVYWSDDTFTYSVHFRIEY